MGIDPYVIYIYVVCKMLLNGLTENIFCFYFFVLNSLFVFHLCH